MASAHCDELEVLSNLCASLLDEDATRSVAAPVKRVKIPVSAASTGTETCTSADGAPTPAAAQHKNMLTSGVKKLDKGEWDPSPQGASVGSVPTVSLLASSPSECSKKRGRPKLSLFTKICLLCRTSSAEDDPVWLHVSPNPIINIEDPEATEAQPSTLRVTLRWAYPPMDGVPAGNFCWYPRGIF